MAVGRQAGGLACGRAVRHCDKQLCTLLVSRPGVGNVIVAVVDTGCDLTHPDLQANFWVNPGEVPGNGIDDDGNGGRAAVAQRLGTGPCPKSLRVRA